MENYFSEEIEKLSSALSEYCITVCRSKCCKIGKISIDKELHDRTNTNLKFSKLKSIISINDCTMYELDISNGCGYLTKSCKCKLFRNEHRPKICSEFPIFKKEKTIIISSFCEAYKSGLFDELIKNLKQKDFNVIIQ